MSSQMIATTTVALAPFDNLSGEPRQDYLTRGFVEDLATELSRFGTLDVFCPREAEACVNAAHLLRGSIRRTGDVMRIVVQLLEARSGRQLWANRYEATAAELLDVQDEIAARVAGALAIEVDGVRLAAARRTPLSSLEAYDC